MIATRVGYAGGTTSKPTYSNIGDHSEAIQIDFDPTRISFETLMQMFWQGHDPTSRSWSNQYKSVLFYHNDEQKRLAEQTKKKMEVALGSNIHTEIRPVEGFTAAENYHQKYYLQNDRELMREFSKMYPRFEDFIGSTAAARINGYLGGNGTKEGLKAQIDSYGLSPSGKLRILGFAHR